MINKYFNFPDKGAASFIIAELSANHNNNFDLTVKTLEAIALSGADAVKVQTYTAESLTLNVDNEYFGKRKEGLWKGWSPYDLFQKGSLPFEWHQKLKEIAESLGLIFFSSPFDLAAVDFLESINVQLYKVASPEITDIPLIEKIAKTGKPIILSTGMAGLEDIELAIQTIKENGNPEFALLKCTSDYPAKYIDANLKTIPDLITRFNCPVGVSDHSDGFIVPAVAVSLGALIIEKHFILDRKLGGIDSGFSMEPSEFTLMVKTVRNAEMALGEISYDVKNSDKLRRRSLFATADICEGELLNQKNFRSIRPGHGIHPMYTNQVNGMRALVNISKGTPLNFGMLGINEDKKN